MLLTIVIVMFLIWLGVTLFSQKKPDGFYKDYSFILTLLVLMAELANLIITTGCT